MYLSSGFFLCFRKRGLRWPPARLFPSEPLPVVMLSVYHGYIKKNTKNILTVYTIIVRANNRKAKLTEKSLCN